jgi:hypothetical protein
MLELPEWTPEPVKPILEGLHQHPRTFGPRRAVLERLLTDPRMRVVYDEFLRRDRKTGNFFNSARSSSEGRSAEEAQLAAIREILQLVLSAAGDKIAVSKIEEIEAAKLRWQDDAKRLRLLGHDIELAAELGMLGIDDPESRSQASQDIQLVRRLATWLEHLTSTMRQPDDPLIVERHRGDPIVRGVQIMISVKLKETFGERFDGIAAILTSVALGAETSPRVSRSALAGKSTL